jgi:PPOX class probable F420-dependent enzyme
MTALLDVIQERHAHIDQRLRDERIAWLISGRPDGRPHAVPIGFFWDGEFIWIFTRPTTQKIQNIRTNAQVLLVLDDTRAGSDPISLEGTAALLATESVLTTLVTYAEKYVDRFTSIGLTLEGLAAQYSQGIRITPTRVVDLIPTAQRRA